MSSYDDPYPISNQPQIIYNNNIQTNPIPTNLVTTGQSRISNPFTNQYQSIHPNLLTVQPSFQQSYNVNPRPTSIIHQNVLNPTTFYTSSNQSNQVLGQQINQIRYSNAVNSQSNVKSRLIPVTQYIPIYQVENYNSIPQEESYQQRIILHQPQAFKERVIYEQKYQVIPTMVQQQKVAANVQEIQNSTIKVVKVPQDSLVQTVNGGWRSGVGVGASRSSFSPPPPVPRQEKSCLNGWLLLLLGLLALGGILAAVLIGKMNSSREVNTNNQVAVSGTRVGSALGPTQIKTVQPLINTKITEVKGNTAVTNPITITGKAETVTPTKTIFSVNPTDISKVATVTPSGGQTIIVKPQQIGVTTVDPVIVDTSKKQVIVLPNTNTVNDGRILIGEPTISKQKQIKIGSTIPASMESLSLSDSIFASENSLPRLNEIPVDTNYISSFQILDK